MSKYKLLINILLCLYFVFVATVAAQAAATNNTMLTSSWFKKIFTEIVTAAAPWPIQDLVVTGFTVQPTELAVPAGTIGYRLLNQPHNRHLGRKNITVVIQVNETDVGQVKMRGSLQLYGDVLLLVRRVARHTLLASDDIKTVRQNISQLAPDIIRSPAAAIGKRVRVSSRAGTILHAHLLEKPPMVKRGDRVTIVAQSGQLRVTAPGEVRNSGALGDMVLIKNMMSRREIYGRVLGPGIVETIF